MGVSTESLREAPHLPAIRIGEGMGVAVDEARTKRPEAGPETARRRHDRPMR